MWSGSSLEKSAGGYQCSGCRAGSYDLSWDLAVVDGMLSGVLYAAGRDDSCGSLYVRGRAGMEK